MNYLPASADIASQNIKSALTGRYFVNSIALLLWVVAVFVLIPSVATAKSIVEDYPAGVIVVVEFDSNSTELTANSQWLLSALAERLSAGQYQNRALSVEGHTDTLGNSSFNLKLSHDRAVVVSKYLEGLLVKSRVRLVATGLGEALPRQDDRHNEAARQKNRRVEIRLML